MGLLRQALKYRPPKAHVSCERLVQAQDLRLGIEHADAPRFTSAMQRGDHGIELLAPGLEYLVLASVIGEGYRGIGDERRCERLGDLPLGPRAAVHIQDEVAEPNPFQAPQDSVD